MSELTDITDPIVDAVVVGQDTVTLISECGWCGSKEPSHKCQLTLHQAYGLYPSPSNQMDYPLNTGADKQATPSILERMLRREDQGHAHSRALDNHSARLRRIENALGLDPMPELDSPATPTRSFNY